MSEKLGAMGCGRLGAREVFGRYFGRVITGKMAIGEPKSSFRHILPGLRERAPDDRLCRPYPHYLPQACMTIFRLKQIASTSFHAAADAMQWNYDRAELIADGVVHIVGVCFGLVAATALIVLTAVYATAVDIAAVSVYVAGLLAML